MENAAYPVVDFNGSKYLSTSRMSTLFRQIDPNAAPNLNGTTGVYSAKVLGNDISLNQDQDMLKFGSAMIRTTQRLLISGGGAYIPLSSVDIILRRIPGITTNIAQILPAGVPVTPSPATSPSANVSAPALPAPAVEPTVIAATPLPTSTPDTAVAQAASPVAEAATPAATMTPDVPSIPSIDTGPTLPSYNSSVIAGILQNRRTIVLDPQVITSWGDNDQKAMASRLTYDIAMKCKQLIESSTNPPPVVVTRARTEDSPSADQRIQAANSSQGRILVSICADSSPFPKSSGFRIYAANEAVDPDSRGARGSAAAEAQVAYLPFQQASLTLTRFLEYEMGKPAAPTSGKVKLAPLFLLKRASLPSAVVSVGYASNPDDLQKMKQTSFASNTARQLAAAVLGFDRWITEGAPENSQ